MNLSFSLQFSWSSPLLLSWSLSLKNLHLLTPIYPFKHFLSLKLTLTCMLSLSQPSSFTISTIPSFLLNHSPPLHILPIGRMSLFISWSFPIPLLIRLPFSCWLLLLLVLQIPFARHSISLFLWSALSLFFMWSLIFSWTCLLGLTQSPTFSLSLPCKFPLSLPLFLPHFRVPSLFRLLAPLLGVFIL